MYIYIHIIDIIYKYYKCINFDLFLNIYMHVCIFIYTHNKNKQYTHIYYVYKNFYFGCD